MKMRSADFARLTRVTEAVLAAEQARVAELLARERKIRADLNAIDQSTRDRADQLSSGPDTALLAGADLRWSVWIEERRTALLSDLARISAEREEQKGRLAKALGRNEAADTLMRRARAIQTQKRDSAT